MIAYVNLTFYLDQPFALLGTDNYQTFAVYGLCTPTNKSKMSKDNFKFCNGLPLKKSNFYNFSVPVVWVAVTDEVFAKGIPKETHQSIMRILEDNNIDQKSLVHVNQKDCSP